MIGLIDVDGKLPNLALMKISNYYKKQGEDVEFVKSNKIYDKIFASSIFTKSKKVCEKLLEQYGEKIEIGGTGWSLDKTLPKEIEEERPDYNLYTVEDILPKIRGIMTKEKKRKKAEIIINAGIGRTSIGCIRNCKFCVVPQKEGCFKHIAEIKDLINPRSNVLILHDNNITADPNCISILNEIRDRKLIVDINQGCDIRLMTDDIANAMSEIKHLRSIHYSWDLMGFEKNILDGIKIMTKYIKAYKHMCYMLVGFNTTFEEDMYRYRVLDSLNIRPYVMVYNQKKDTRLNHFARWVNARICKACSWSEYEPWVKSQKKLEIDLFGGLE